MGSAISTFSTRLGDFGRERADAGAALVETVGAAALDIAAADHEFRRAALQQADHLRQLGLVVLQIGVDDRGIGRAGGEDALDAGARQAAPPDPADAADAGILPRQAAHHFPGAVGGIVVDEHDFPGDVLERRLQPPVQNGDVVALVEGGDDDRKLRQTGGLRRVFGARFDGVIHERQRIAAAARDSKAGGMSSDRGKTGQNSP